MKHTNKMNHPITLKKGDKQNIICACAWPCEFLVFKNVSLDFLLNESVPENNISDAKKYIFRYFYSTKGFPAKYFRPAQPQKIIPAKYLILLNRES